MIVGGRPAGTCSHRAQQAGRSQRGRATAWVWCGLSVRPCLDRSVLAGFGRRTADARSMRRNYQGSSSHHTHACSLHIVLHPPQTSLAWTKTVHHHHHHHARMRRARWPSGEMDGFTKHGKRHLSWTAVIGRGGERFLSAISGSSPQISRLSPAVDALRVLAGARCCCLRPP